MTKNKNGNNKDGLGIMNLMHLTKHYPVRYWFSVLAIELGWFSLAKKILDIK